MHDPTECESYPGRPQIFFFFFNFTIEEGLLNIEVGKNIYQSTVTENFTLKLINASHHPPPPTLISLISLYVFGKETVLLSEILQSEVKEKDMHLRLITTSFFGLVAL